MQVSSKLWLDWPLQQRHAGFLGRSRTLLSIAAGATRHSIVPGVETATRARHHVVDRQFLWPRAAVLALMQIPLKDLSPAVPGSWSRTLDEVDQPDDRWPVE